MYAWVYRTRVKFNVYCFEEVSKRVILLIRIWRSRLLIHSPTAKDGPETFGESMPPK